MLNCKRFIAFLVVIMVPFFIIQGANPKNIYHENWIDFNKNGEMDPYENSELEINQRIDDLISRMNLNEKTCQMATLYGYGRVLQDELPKPGWKNELWKDGIGNIDEQLNGLAYHPSAKTEYSYPHSKHTRAINKIQKWFVEETRVGIPVDFTNEGIRGICHDRATAFPAQIALGSTWDRELIAKIGEITAKEGRILGYTNVYSPIMDLPRDQRWGRIVECYGESPYLVSELGKLQVKNIQANGMASTSKHYAVYSAPKGGRDANSRTDPHVTSRDMHRLYLSPFKSAIKEAGGLGVMSSYNDYNAVPVTGSSYFLTKILRKQWGFEGYIVSDSKAVGFIYDKHEVAPTYKNAVYQSVKAGLNVRTQFTPPSDFVRPLRELVKEGQLSEKLIDERVRDILRVKFKLGLFDQPYVENPEKADEIVGSKDHHKVSLRASRECMVLLKNNGILPLNKQEINTILVTGPNAKAFDHAISRYGPNNVKVITLFEGLQKVLSDDAEILYTRGCDFKDQNYPESEIMDFPISEKAQKEIDKAKKLAKQADVIIAAMGENESLVGEGRTRTSLDLSGNQQKLLKALHSTGKPVIGVLINGRPLSINWMDKNIPAIIEAWFSGPYGGQAIAEVIFGDYNPGGKIANTFPKSVGQIKWNFPWKKGSQNPPASWSTMGGKPSMVHGPLYPFGHGLSYTTFEYSNLEIKPNKQSPDGNISINCSIENTGNRKGDEIVQLYIKDEYSSVVTYEKQLRGFRRISLKPGESKNISFALEPEDLELLDKNMEWRVEPGRFIIQIGRSSEDIRLKDDFRIVE